MKEKKLNRYLCFRYADYYPNGGLSDSENFKTLEECKDYYKDYKSDYNYILDLETRKVIWDSDSNIEIV